MQARKYENKDTTRMNNGWVKLHRQTFDNKLWLSEPFTKGQAWVDLFANANHKDGQFFVRGNEVKINRGQIGWSEITMAMRWRWSRMKVRRFLHVLEVDGQVIQHKMHKLTTILTVVNYSRYQDETTDETTERQQKDNRRDTNKNVKKKENVKNANNTGGEDAAPNDINPLDYQLSRELLERIRNNTPTFKEPNLESWAAHVRLMRERDERTEKQIRFLIDWCQKDHFWQANILSTKKLREKFDTLVAQVKRNETTPITKGRGLA